MWMFYSALQRSLDFKRTCPYCKTPHRVKVHERHRSAKCHKCGKTIPAPKSYRS